MNPHDMEIVLRLSVALIAGALIGYERSYHGRPAGFRTHTLVCTAASLLMLITVYQEQWFHVTSEIIRIDPTRMAQGIMTGIGFLGAGAIIKEGLSVRGLTTAASIWMTSAIGIIAGIGFYFPLAVAVVMTLGALSTFRWIERHMPAQVFYQFDINLDQSSAMDEEDLRAFVEKIGFSVANFSYQMNHKGQTRRYSMVLRSLDHSCASRLYKAIKDNGSILEFKITPTGDK